MSIAGPTLCRTAKGSPRGGRTRVPVVATVRARQRPLAQWEQPLGALVVATVAAEDVSDRAAMPFADVSGRVRAFEYGGVEMRADYRDKDASRDALTSGRGPVVHSSAPRPRTLTAVATVTSRSSSAPLTDRFRAVGSGPRRRPGRHVFDAVVFTPTEGP